MLLHAALNNNDNNNNDDEEEEEEEEDEEEEGDMGEQEKGNKLDGVILYKQGPPVQLPEEVTFKWTCPSVTAVLKDSTLKSENATDLRLSPVLHAFGYVWQLSLDWINGKFQVGIYLISFARNIKVLTQLTVRSAQPHVHADKISKWERRKFTHYACNRLILGVLTSVQPFIHEKTDSLQVELVMRHCRPLVHLSRSDKYVYDLQQRLCYLYKNRSNPDIELVTKDKTVKIGAHRVVLCMQSSVLMKVFEDLNKTEFSHYNDLTAPNLLCLLEILYTYSLSTTRESTIQDMEQVLSMICLANEDEVPVVMYLLKPVLIRLLTPQNALAVRHSITQMEQQSSNDACRDRHVALEELSEVIKTYCMRHNDAIQTALMQHLYQQRAIPSFTDSGTLRRVLGTKRKRSLEDEEI